MVALVRHGQTAWNRERRFLGQTDIPLDDTGRGQAQAVAGALPPLDALYASPLSRAHQTAEAIAAVQGLAIQTAPGLVEVHQGELEGLRGLEAIALHGELLAAWRSDPTDVVIPGGESLRQAQHRVVAAFRDVVRVHQPGQRVALVTHQLALASLVCHVLGEPLAGWRAHGVGNAHVTWLAGPSPWEVLVEDQAP